MKRKIAIIMLLLMITTSNIAFATSGVATKKAINKTSTSNYNNSLINVTNIQFALKLAKINIADKWVIANKSQIKYYVDPTNAKSSDKKYQFLKLNYTNGISVTQVDKILQGKGVLHNKGQSVLEACKTNNVNPAYLISHAFLETGNGKSPLSNGVIVTHVKGKPVVPKVSYNLFGIGALDASAVQLGSEYAYTSGWFSIDKAISGGASWISRSYINNATNKQNTLYKMRWNPHITGTHQYASDIGWASKQTTNVKLIMDNFKTADLYFDVPKYVKK